ncbi:hypothetical protein KZO58_11650 [Prevotella histicola]|uniref:hypothetical protein n=1 Tax=Prevotella histicola TaxID=470565 RepID=UPI001C5F2975|nr:hypothetical protein [Prevotella histicola]MBW4740135.1 hypothetical protein [Prevotella histicola]MBW4748408.1 hypothetical protein [Prevotella histicola]
MKKNIFFPIACALMAAPLLTSCQDDVDSSAGENSNIHTYSLVADASEGLQQAPASRALTEDASHNIKSSWANEDEILTYVINDGLEATNYSIITNKNLGNGNRFDGEIASKKAITTSSQIAFLYPGKAAQGNDKTITPVVLSKERSSLFHEESDKTQELVALNLTQQDGTAETIGNRFDFQWAKQSPKSVNGKKVNVNIGKMKRLVTIWGLRFTDDKNKPLANIDSIYVSNVKGSDVLKLSDGTFVDGNPEDEMMNVVLKPKAGKKFSSVGGNYTYVAFLPGTYEDVVVTAYVGSKVYQKSYSSITFGSDKIYRTDLLKMEDTKQKAYVEIQGIKWATGNFIHYKEGSQEYWGIAPTQWWISRRAVMLNSNRKEVSSGGILQSSQFESSPKQTTDDVDLFRFGSIAKALSFNGLINGADTWGENEISQKISSDGKHGDIVWYYTKGNKRKYRMPTEAELRTLYTTANVIPAYCYTDKGTVVYGAFFTNNASNDANKRKKLFPTKAKKYDKYTNVTALVRANKGLFLPVTGRRLNGSDVIGYRDMAYGAGAYGQYMSSTSALMNWDFFFGPTEWNFAKAPKAQAKAIRPVLVEESATGSDNSFAPFANIK